MQAATRAFPRLSPSLGGEVRDAAAPGTDCWAESELGNSCGSSHSSPSSQSHCRVWAPVEVGRRRPGKADLPRLPGKVPPTLGGPWPPAVQPQAAFADPLITSITQTGHISAQTNPLVPPACAMPACAPGTTAHMRSPGAVSVFQHPKSTQFPPRPRQAGRCSRKSDWRPLM